MQINKHLSALAALLLMGGAQAVAQRNIYFTLDGIDTPQTELIKHGSRITFADGSLTLTTPQEEGIVLGLSDIVKITFDYTPTAVSDLAVSDVRFAREGDAISASGLKVAQPAAIYSVSGQQIYRNAAWNGESIDVSGLAHGVYVLRTQGASFKFVR